MPAAVKKATATVPAHRAEKTAYAVLGVLEKAGKEITLLAREGKKRVAAHERKAVSAARAPKKARKA
ncbi:MAG: hypothetical protein WEB06_18880 [Actinomycetota bacterium]